MEEQRMILKMIEDGKITAEEGIRLLQAIEKTEPSPRSNETSLSTEVNWDEAKRDFKTSRQESGGRKITSFIESAIQKIKDFDLDFNFGTYTTVHHIFHHRSLLESVIDISIENGSITLVPWDEPDVRMECEAKVYKAKDQEDAKQTFLREVVLLGDTDKLKVYSKQKAIKLKATLYVPQKQFQAVSIYTFNGHVKADRLAADKLEAKAVNGSIMFSEANVKKLAAETVHGPIEFSGTAVSCDLRTVNGAITLRGHLPDVDAETVNGTITYEAKDSTETRNYADFKATTGSIHITLPRARVEANLKTNVGNFTYDFGTVEMVEEKKELVQKQIVFLANPERVPTYKIKAVTNTGSISLKDGGLRPAERSNQ